MNLHDVVLLGDDDGNAATELLVAGIHDFVVVHGEVRSAVFDDESDTWTLHAKDGTACRGRVVVTRESPFVATLPDIPGRRDFRGASTHAMTAEARPPGTRVAVIGADSTAGGLIEQFAAAGVTVEVFPLAPRRSVKRRRGLSFRRRVTVVSSPIEEVTPVGIRTVDGAHHDADAIVYGTGVAVRAALPTWTGSGGVSLQEAWTDGAEPYLGLAVHGFPNLFVIDGPDVVAAVGHVAECLKLCGRHTRIEVRRSAQALFNERVHLTRPSRRLDASAFDVATGRTDAAYVGPATLTAAEHSEPVRVQLGGRIEPFDGQYHWQGTVFGEIPDHFTRARAVTLAIGNHTAEARITERTPQGGHSIAGSGSPPFDLPVYPPVVGKTVHVGH